MQSNTHAVENQPVNFSNISVENKPYRSDPFTIRDGRFIGHDGFVVPRNFNEFNERFPQYVRNWVKRHADTSAQKEDLEDWTQDLLIHLQHLPPTSKHRAAGKKDIVQTFDPHRHYGANQARFQNYLNLCLANKFRAIYAKRKKDALSNPRNLSLDTQMEWDDPCSVDDEYCHSHSEHLRKAANASEKRDRDRALLREFVDFVRREDPNSAPAIEVLLVAGAQGTSPDSLAMTESQFTRTRNRLHSLAESFMSGSPVPKQRRPYQKRKALNLAAIPKKMTETPPTPSAAANVWDREFEDARQFLPLPNPPDSISLQLAAMGS
jgi:hypothetical protein